MIPFISFSVSKKPVFIFAGIIIILFIAFLPTYYFYRQYQKAQKILADPSLSSLQEARSLKDKVGKLMVLPPDEDPAVVTVTDKEKLGGQPFFAGAKNGDKVLVFAKAKKAILYDPSANKIVEIGPLIMPSPTPTKEITPLPKPISFAIYNGTASTEALDIAEKNLKSKITNIQVLLKSETTKKKYRKTLVVDLTGTHSKDAATIAKFLNADMMDTVPQDEDEPLSPDPNQKIDFLVIAGKNIMPAVSPTPTPQS